MRKYNGIQSVQLEERDGKYVLEFDDIPSLLFVSFDGNGAHDHTIYDGKQIRNAQAVSIYSALDEFTTYEVKALAISVK